MSVSEVNWGFLTCFKRRVYALTAKIPKGYVATYSQIAEIIGSRKYARAVGNALHVNPFPPQIVPCHRVVKSSGDVGGYAAGARVKINMLIDEGVEVVNGKVNLEKNLINIKLLKSLEAD